MIGVLEHNFLDGVSFVVLSEFLTVSAEEVETSKAEMIHFRDNTIVVDEALGSRVLRLARCVWTQGSARTKHASHQKAGDDVLPLIVVSSNTTCPPSCLVFEPGRYRTERVREFRQLIQVNRSVFPSSF